MKKSLSFWFIALLILSKSLYAESSGKVSHDAHVHGLAELRLALEGSKLVMSLTSPAANIVGFEYKASTPEQKSVVEKARAKLESVNTLFTFVSANCKAEEVEVDVDAVIETDKHHHKGHHHHHDDDHDDTHSEIEAVYHLNCKDASKVSTISVNLFDHFPAIEKLNAMWVTETTQGASELTATSKTIHLRE